MATKSQIQERIEDELDDLEREVKALDKQEKDARKLADEVEAVRKTKTDMMNRLKDILYGQHVKQKTEEASQ